jgi:hypothetical protein
MPNSIDELGTAEERRMNQLSTAEFGATKDRHKFGRADRMRPNLVNNIVFGTPLNHCRSCVAPVSHLIQLSSAHEE